MKEENESVRKDPFRRTRETRQAELLSKRQLLYQVEFTVIRPEQADTLA